jgi:hypothetical protein
VTIIGVGLVVAMANGFSETGSEGGTLLVAAGLSVWLINALYRFGVSGDREREDEDRAEGSSTSTDTGRTKTGPPSPTGPRTTASVEHASALCES